MSSLSDFLLILIRAANIELGATLDESHCGCSVFLTVRAQNKRAAKPYETILMQKNEIHNLSKSYFQLIYR
jgi:hypothetical protein